MTIRRKSGSASRAGDVVESVLISELQELSRNTRAHGERNINAIAASLRRFGQQKPIVIDSDGVVLAGNGTLAAAQRLGWDRLLCQRSALRGDEAVAFSIADNRTAELAHWEAMRLTELVSELKGRGIVIDDLGFTDLELSNLGQLGEWAKRQGDGDATTGIVQSQKLVVHVADSANVMGIKDLLMTIIAPYGEEAVWLTGP